MFERFRWGFDSSKIILFQASIQDLTRMSNEKQEAYAKEQRVPIHLVQETARSGHLPVPNFAAGGVASPADAALLMQLGAEAVFVGSGIFLSDNPAARASAIVQAVTHYVDAKKLATVSRGLGGAMRGIDPARETVTLEQRK
jgi:pyridoxal 5'-phosphate synthase pdxS subunit